MKKKFYKNVNLKLDNIIDNLKSITKNLESLNGGGQSGKSARNN